MSVQIRSYGHSAFHLSGSEHSVFFDPHGPMPDLPVRFEYPPIRGVTTDLLLITHEHPDHNNAEAIEHAGHVIRSSAGTHRSPIGEVVSIASEHDPVAGTALGENTILVFTLDGLRIAHFGDFGQRGLRPEQREALGAVDLVFVPVGGNDATLDGQAAARLVGELGPSWAIPMHYETEATDFLEPVDVFAAAVGGAERSGSTITVSAAERAPSALRCTVLASPAMPRVAASRPVAA
jgi:L-ascorbate metabolism protein UlaG (beta-lactamase superfamily)